MSTKKSQVFLFDVLTAILKIENTVKTFSNSEELYRSYIHWDSVIREFEIIGESTKRLIRDGIFEEDKRVIVDFRNLLIHHYFGIHPDEVWDIIKNDLSELKGEVVDRIISIPSKDRVEFIEEYQKMHSHLDFIRDFLTKLKD